MLVLAELAGPPGVAVTVALVDGATIDALDRDVALAAAGLVAASALLGAGGVLVGLLARSQVAAVVGVAAWALVFEGVLDVVTGGAVRDWVPGGAAAALAGNGDVPMWRAALVLLGWLAVLGVATVPTVVRRDVE